jgi:hypothetical protein
LKDEIERLLFLVTIINLMGLCQARGATKVRGTLFFQLTGEGLPVVLISGGKLVAKLIRSRTITCQFCPFFTAPSAVLVISMTMLFLQRLSAVI